MKKILLTSLVVLFTASYSFAAAPAGMIKIVKPKNGDKVTSPVEICFETTGLTLEPADNKSKNEGKGHHHILIDTKVPRNLKYVGGKSFKMIHLNGGEPCRSVKIAPGDHDIRGLFTYGDHFPYDPAITDSIFIEVTE
ncbi:MAG: DUF4399 domain-containing protein [Nitrospinae bacterium]|nr:DUF4399 domain-containing protein [Nitrospinota bacterium]